MTRTLAKPAIMVPGEIDPHGSCVLNVTMTHDILCSGSTSCAFHSYPSKSLQPENPNRKRREAAADEIRRIVNEIGLLSFVFFPTYDTKFEFFVQLRGYLEAGNSLPNSINVNLRLWKSRGGVYMEMAQGLMSKDVAAANGSQSLVAQLIYFKYEQMAGTVLKIFIEHYEYEQKYNLLGLQQTDNGENHLQTVPGPEASGHSDQQIHKLMEGQLVLRQLRSHQSALQLQLTPHRHISSSIPLVFMKQFEKQFGKDLVTISPRLR
jgi:hypothetical protein